LPFFIITTLRQKDFSSKIKTVKTLTEVEETQFSYELLLGGSNE